ncbi:MAG: hypothetical protein GKC10_07555 [Methanosarcinales archaeon]|nr:hypothetical protein [Methanosarcinales archaeon]
MAFRLGGSMLSVTIAGPSSDGRISWSNVGMQGAMVVAIAPMMATKRASLNWFSIFCSLMMQFQIDKPDPERAIDEHIGYKMSFNFNNVYWLIVIKIHVDCRSGQELRTLQER